MSFSLDDDKGVIKVVVSKDSAVGCTPEEHKSYLEDLNEEKLNLKSEPTRFVLRKNLDYKANQVLFRSQGRVVKGQMKTDIASFLTEIRLYLIGVENPSSLPESQHIVFKRDTDGYANKELVAKLQNYGVLMELVLAVKYSKGDLNADALTKKS